MACYHPLFAVRVDDLRRPIKILGSKPSLNGIQGIDPNGVVDLIDGYFFDGKKWHHESELLKLPCGQCAGCRLDNSREWADRCTMEGLYHDSEKCWFITLTYDNDHLPGWASGYVSDSPYPYGSLLKDELSNFMKDLRESARYHNRGNELRFYGCGEYGTKSLRPHYHLIVYGLDLSDNDFYKRNRCGDALYNNKWLEGVWQNGFVVIGHFDWRTAAYTARYVMKKRKGKNSKEEYEKLDVTPEYTRMSLRPGIAYNYFAANYQRLYYENARIVLPAIDGKANITSPPRYFDKCFEKLGLDAQDQLAFVKEERRRIAEEMEVSRLQFLRILDEEEFLAHEEKIFMERPQFRLDI